MKSFLQGSSGQVADTFRFDSNQFELADSLIILVPILRKMASTQESPFFSVMLQGQEAELVPLHC